MTRRAAVILLGLAALLALLLPAGPAQAHAFGMRYDLPLPFGFYLSAAAAAVALSFLVMALLAKVQPEARAPLYLILVERPDSSPLARRVAMAFRVLGVLVFLLLLAIGFFGPSSAMESLTTVTVWVLWWVGFLLFSAMVANAWGLLDPWRTLYGLLPKRAPRLSDPASLGCWPAVFLLLAFVWMELVGDLGHEPRGLARIILSYSIITWLLMALFGAEVWSARFDPFGRLFALVGRFAPIGRFDGEAGRPLVLRLPGAALIERPAANAGEVAFLMVLLSTVTFDGFAETPAWAAFLQWVSESQDLRPLLLWASEGRLGALGLIKSAALLAAPLIFAFVLWVFSILSHLASGQEQSSGSILRHFAVTLLPIAIAYHLAHYASYLLMAGQLAIPLISDPFGLGWNLFGTGGYLVDMGIVGAKDVWYLSIFAIVIGHVFAVVLAHLQALRLFSTTRAALMSQIPLLALMLLFTVSSLWILAQPVIVQ